MSLKICVLSESMQKPFDEGVKIFVFNLIKEFSKYHEILALSRYEESEEEIEPYFAKALPKNRLLISCNLRKKIRTFKPDVIYYIPTACATIYSFLRAKILKKYSQSAKMVMITLQPREYSALKKKIIPFITPDLVLAQSEKTKEVLMSLGCKVRLISGGVDLQKFVPTDQQEKANLRRKYGFPSKKHLVLHVGHINRNRNIPFLLEIQKMEDIQSIVVGSTSYSEDKELVRELKKKGVIVITQYLENIEEIYQSADCYLFPVFSEGACIEIPLSILEAMACNLPVVSSEFGGLPHLITEVDGFQYVKNQDEIISKISSLRRISDPGTRRLVSRYSWKLVATQVLINSDLPEYLIEGP